MFEKRLSFPSKNAQLSCRKLPQWGAADAEIKVPSVENTELKGFPFHAWSRSVYSRTSYFLLPWISSLLISTLPVHSPAFLKKNNLSQLFHLLAVANIGSCVGPQDKIGHPVGCRFPCRVPTEFKLAKNNNMTCDKKTCEMNNSEIE